MKNILYYKKPVFWLLISLIIVLIIAGLALLTNLLPKPNQDDLSSLDGFTANIQVSVSGMGVTNQDIRDDADKLIIQTAILDCSNSTAVWGGKPVDEMPDRVQILLSENPVGSTTRFTLIVDETGSPCIISNQDNRFCAFGEERLNALLAIVRKGFYENSAMTVSSGDNTVQALGHWVNSYDKITKVSADGMYLPAQGIKMYLTYLPIDLTKGVKGGSQPFAAYVNGQEIYGDFTLYDEQMIKIEVIEPSGLAPQMTMLKGLAPGRYIVELRTRFETLVDESGYQYFFGIVIQ